MSHAADSSTPGRIETAAFDWKSWLQVLLLAALISLLYYRILASLVLQWWKDPDYSHGFIVPIFCAWVLWKKRKRLAKEPIQPNWFGLVVILGALGILVLGVLGADNFLSRTSLLFLLAGCTIQFCGWRYFRAVLFPWVAMFLMIPPPAILFNQIAMPLQFFASRLASGLLALIGVPVLREGNVIYLPSLTLDVAEACSGLRFVVALLTLAVFYGYLFETRISRRIVLILSSIPIAVATNGLRIMGSGVLGEYWSPDKAEGFFHLYSGWLIFVFSLGLLFLFHAVLGFIDHHRLVRRV
ncbi:MAG: exosortase A [Candidatus Acidiferrales bacterium]